MSTDEHWVLLGGWLVAALTWWGWYSPLVARVRSGPRQKRDAVPWLSPLVCHGTVLLVLLTLAADDVRDAPRYVLLYLGLGSAWVGLLQSKTIWLGVGGREDAVERSNVAAAVVSTGALLGLALCFAGGNVGNGPGWWVVLFGAALATSAWFGSWWAVEAATGVSELVTVERDLATGLRLASFLVGSGLLLGAAVAGDWESLEATLLDFALFGWPVVGLVLAEVAIGKLNPRAAFLRGALPALAYVTSVLYLVAERAEW